MKKALRIFIKFLERIPYIGTPIKVANIEIAIDNLKRKGNLQKARELRSEALKAIPISHQGPLLRSEGEDRLYNQKNHAGALEIFEKAIFAMDQAPSSFGITMADRVYAGASQAALFCGDKEKATEYYYEFERLVKKFEESKKLQKALKWHRNKLKYLESQLMLENQA